MDTHTDQEQKHGPPRDGAYAAALDTLRSHQQDVRNELMAGFEHRQDILLWQHRAGALTIGQIADGWYTETIADRWLCAALLKDQDKRAAMCEADTAPSDRLAKGCRLNIVKDELIPAFQQALTVARELASDYADAGDRAPVADRQRYIFMRPQLDDLYRNQREVLLSALGAGGEEGPDPVTTREGAIDWADSAIYATTGFLPGEFAQQVAHPASEWWGALTESRGPYLELLLAQQVLPAMNRALRDTAKRASESPQEHRPPERPEPA